MGKCIEFNSGQNIMEGIMTYKIQRKHDRSVKITQNESKIIHLLIDWHFEHTKELHVRALLVEHDGELDEHKLRRLHQKYWHPLNAWVNPIIGNWLLDDATVWTITEVKNRGYKWNIIISEGDKDFPIKPSWIDAER
jgi:hypothetical protein